MIERVSSRTESLSQSNDDNASSTGKIIANYSFLYANPVEGQSIQNLHMRESGGPTDNNRMSSGSQANPYEESFFRTAVDTDNDLKSHKSSSKNVLDSEVRLPITVNLVALRETLFVEAPFVNKNNKAFWRKMIDGKHFSGILAASYNFILVCITDNGSVELDKLNDIENSSLIGMIADSMTDMFYTFKRLDRDLFFR
jgi:hypothetical protein